MDFDRAIVKSLFFGSKPGNVLAAVNDEGYKHGRFKADLANLLSVTLPEFTSREMEALARKELSRYFLEISFRQNHRHRQQSNGV